MTSNILRNRHFQNFVILSKTFCYDRYVIIFTGEIRKVRNNLKEFCPTESLHTAQVNGQTYLFSVGSDVDHGDAYINGKNKPG